MVKNPLIEEEDRNHINRKSNELMQTQKKFDIQGAREELARIKPVSAYDAMEKMEFNEYKYLMQFDFDGLRLSLFNNLQKCLKDMQKAESHRNEMTMKSKKNYEEDDTTSLDLLKA